MRKNQFRLKPAYAAVLLAFAAQTTQANPIGAAVVAGQASFATAGKTLTVTNTPNTIINWQGFSIGANEITRFAQQSASSAVLNRVIANNPSNILGSLQSNGRVFLVNPSGIVFGANATVNVAGMVASTLNLSNSDFLAGRYRFTNPSPTGGGAGVGVVVNAGNLTAQTGGQIYLIAPNVENTGIINAPNGEILLAAGHSVELVNSNDPNLRVNITAPAGDATNIGQLVASSGSLGLFGAVVRNTGTVSADSATMQGGKIVFKASQRVDAGGTISATTATAPVPSPTGGGLGRGSGGTINILADMQTGTVNVTGTLDASSIAPSPSIPLPQGGEGSVVLPSTTALLPSPLAGEGLGERGSSANGGQIETSAAHVNIADTARVTTAAAQGLAGTWLIDPFDFTIAASGGNMTGATLSTNLGGGNVSILSTSGTTGTAGDVNVNDVVTWSANRLTLNAQNNININANLNGSGSASLALEYGQQAVAAGNLSDTIVHAAVNLPAGTTNFTTKLGSDGAVKAYTVITSLGAAGSVTGTDLQGMNGGRAANYALGSNIDATTTSAWNAGAGFVPVGTFATRFTGTFDGLGHTVSNLFINRPTTSDVGLFGCMNGSTSAIRNVGLVGGSVSGFDRVGGLVGYILNGSVSNSYTTGSVSSTGNCVGGLVGCNSISGTINNSYSTGSVSGSGNYNFVGGLVGLSNGMVSNSYATGSVSGTGNFDNVGGLVGANYGTVSTSYATGSVTGSGSNGTAGGLMGFNYGTVSTSYATGSVSGSSYVGGLVGRNDTGTVSNTYATGVVTGTTNVGGLVGYNYGTISNGNWNSTVNVGGMVGIGGGTLTGATGLTTTAMQTASNFTGFVFTTTPGAAGNNWVMVDADGTLNNAASAAGATYPMLASEYSTTINNAHQLQLMEMALGASYTLGSNIDAAKTATSTDVWGSAGFVPVGNLATPFTGTFDGLNHTVSTLFINRPTTSNVGLFGVTGTGSTIKNVGLVGGSVSGASNVGGLVGVNRSTISNSYATGSVSGGIAIADTAGGLVGNNSTGGTISSSYATGSVSGSIVGGLAGRNTRGTISNSYATGSVSGSSYVGGLVGYNYGTVATISNSYATGSVSGSSYVGGLVGMNDGSTVSNSYATGSVSGTGIRRGLVGMNYGTVSNSFWDKTTSGRATSSGGTGLTTAEMMQLSSFNSWNTAIPNTIANTGGSGATWRIYEGHTAPLLTSFLTPLTLTGTSDATVTYNGSAQTFTTSYTGSTQYGANTAISGVLGSGVASGANAAVYGGYYSAQQGYDLTGGNLIITPFASVAWTGASGNWSDAANWAGGYLPVGTNVLAVTIPSGVTVTYDAGVTGTTTLTTLTSSGNFAMAAGTLTTSGNFSAADYQQTGGTLNVGGNINTANLALAAGVLNVSGSMSVTQNLANLWGTLTASGNISTASYQQIGGVVNVGGSMSVTQSLAMDAGTLTASGNISTVGYQQTGGTLNVGGNMAVTQSFAKASGATGSLVMTGANSALSIAQSAGDLAFYNDQTIKLGAVSAPGAMLFSTTGGDITVNDAVTWSANLLTLSAQNNININANMNASNSASLALIYGQGAVELYNASALSVHAAVNLPAGTANFTTRLGSNGVVNNYIVITSLGLEGSVSTTNLQGINGGLAGNYVLGANIDATATSGWNAGAGFVPIGNATTKFTGTFDGLGHTINNLTINRPTTNNVGLFGYTTTSASHVIRNVGLVGGSVSGASFVGGLIGYNELFAISNSYTTGSVSGASYVGGLVGKSWANSVSNSYATGNVSGTSIVGGLLGYSVNSVSNSYATGNVSGSGTYWSNFGGLVGICSSGTISNSYATGNVSRSGSQELGEVGGLVGANRGTVSNSYATGSVSNSGVQGYVGGLVGRNGGTVSNSYATGSASNSGNSSSIGGLVGVNEGGKTISNSFATGSVSATGVGLLIGGLVGWNYNGDGFSPNGTVSSSYWNTQTSGQPTIGIAGGILTGATGLTSAQMQTAANFTGFVFTTTPGATGNNWVMVDADGTLNNAAGAAGATYPMLASEYSTTINNAHQLQLMEMAPAASYTLGSNIDAAKTATSTDVWGSAGFVPVGNATTNFTGTFDGLNHTVSNLFINRPTTNGVGLFGATGTGSMIRNVGLVGGSVIGDNFVGALVGGITNGTIISNSYATGSVSGTGSMMGVGGLVGINNNGTISSSYATGSVSGSQWVGGLVGGNGYGTISNSYATGSVSGTTNIGGLVGFNFGTVTNSFWNTQTSGQLGLLTGATGLTTAQMQQSNFTGWDFANTWIGYDGYTNPLLRSFMTPLTVTANNAAKTYDGLVYSGAYGVTYSSTPNANLLGTASYGGTSQSATNAGSYAITPGGLYSNQQGYIIGYVNGALTINAAAVSAISLTGTRAYDGTADVAASVFTQWSGLVGTQTLTLTGVGIMADKNVGVTKTVSLGSLALGNGTNGGLASNYTFTGGTQTATITAAALGINAATDSKTYDGLTASAGIVTFTGLQTGDSVTGATQSFGSKNVLGANGSTLSATGYTVNDGNGGANYSVTANTATGTITKAALSVTASAAAKTYDGLAYTGGNGVAYSGWVNSEGVGVLGGALAYGGTSQNAINAGSYLITPGGLTSGNYTLSYVDGVLTVNKASLTAALIGTPTKVYDGVTAATLAASNYSLTGFVGSEGATVGQTAGIYNSKDVATASTINATLAANDFTGTGSTLLANYLLPTTASGAGSITPAGLTVTANALSKTAGGVDPLLTYMTAGLQAPDTTTSTLSGALARLAGETAGLYAINQGTLVSLSTNYTMSYVPADFGVVAAAVVVAPVVAAPVVVATPPLVTAPVVTATVMDALMSSIVTPPPGIPFNPPIRPVMMQPAPVAPVAAPAVVAPVDGVSATGGTGTPADAAADDPKKDAQALIVADVAVPVAAPAAQVPMPVCK